MQTIRLKAHIDATHRLQIDLPADTPQGDAEVIVLLPSSAVAGAAEWLHFFDALDRQPVSEPRTAAQIAAHIEGERLGWD